MKQAAFWRICATAAVLALATGCAANPTPQRSPGPNQGNTASSTTGDWDACAMALGNMLPVGGVGAGAPGPNVTTAPGGVPGGTQMTGTDRNVAPGAGTTGTTGGATGVTNTPGAVGNTAPGVTGGDRVDITNVGTPAGRQEITANGILLGNVALVALPTLDNAATNLNNTGTVAPGGAAAPGVVTPPGTAGNTAPIGGSPAPPVTTATPGVDLVPPAANQAPGAKGAAPGATAPGATPAGDNATALDRIRANCNVVQIRVVAEADRNRIAKITADIRDGTPVSDYIDEIARMNKAATIAWAGPPVRAGGAVGTTPAPGAVPVPAPATPAPVAP